MSPFKAGWRRAIEELGYGSLFLTVFTSFVCGAAVTVCLAAALVPEWILLAYALVVGAVFGGALFWNHAT